MSQNDIAVLTEAMQTRWHYPVSAKAQRYVSQFFERTRTGKTIVGHVIGNHGTYTVSIAATGKTITSACSCYVGASGTCHHCHALAATFLTEPQSFTVVPRPTRKGVKTLADVGPYLKGVSLDAVLQQLKAAGISQKQLAESLALIRVIWQQSKPVNYGIGTSMSWEQRSWRVSGCWSVSAQASGNEASRLHPSAPRGCGPGCSFGWVRMAYGTLRVRKRQTLALLLTLPLVLHNNETAKKPGRQEYQKRSFIVLCGN